jgi:hypothetical protein
MRVSRLILRRREAPSRRMGRRVPSCFETPRLARRMTHVKALKARLLSMRAGEGGHWWPHEVTCSWLVESTNLRVWKTDADEGRLFPACYLQGGVQRKRVSLPEAAPAPTRSSSICGSGPTSSMTRRAISAGPSLVRCSAGPLLLHDDRCADLDPTIEIDHVLIGHANAAR